MYVIRVVHGVKPQVDMNIASGVATLVPTAPDRRSVVMLHNPSTTSSDIFYVKLHNADSGSGISSTSCIERIGAGETRSYQVDKGVRIFVLQGTGAAKTLCVQEGY